MDVDVKLGLSSLLGEKSRCRMCLGLLPAIYPIVWYRRTRGGQGLMDAHLIITMTPVRRLALCPKSVELNESSTDSRWMVGNSKRRSARSLGRFGHATRTFDGRR